MERDRKSQSEIYKLSKEKGLTPLFSMRSVMNIKTAEILCVGTEILLGDIVNTNAAFLSSELASLGISQYRQSVIGDNSERLEQTVKQALEQCDLLVMTGGLGPTYDDITKETVAKALGKELVYHEESFKNIENYFLSRGRTMTENNKKQAMVIEGCVVLDNEVGTAPGIYCEEKGKTVVLMPGPPNEMTVMWKNKVKPLLSKDREKVFLSRNINIVGIGEAAVAQKLEDMMKNAVNPTIAPYCKTGEVRLRVTASADTKEEALEMCNNVIREISASEIGSYIYGIDTDLPKAVVNALKRKELKFTSAESCTAGLISKMLTDVPGASEVFDGGVISYSDKVKNRLLGVPSGELSEHGAVSHQVAVKMAKGVRELMGADISVAVTGIAGPGGGSEEKPVGLVYIAVDHQGKVNVTKFKFGSHLSRDRIRELTAVNAFTEVLKAIK